MTRRAVTPLKLLGVLVLLVFGAALVLYDIPSSSYLLLPDTAHPVAPLVTVEGAHPAKGTGAVYFVDVVERRANELESLFPWIYSGSSLVPKSDVVPAGESSKAAQQADLEAMSVSQKIAAAVALRRLGYHVVTRPSGVVVFALEPTSKAVGKVLEGDVITGVNGTPTPTVARLLAVMKKVRPGTSISLALARGSKHVTVRVQTSADPRQPSRAIVGFLPEQAAQITLPIKVRIDAGGVGGPSAGLAFALEVMQKLGRNVARGYRVAATGELDLAGDVLPIGGVKQKTFGVRRAHADVFLVPVGGDNARDAKRYAHGLRIIPVKSFAQALHALATLPPKG
ncbi:MAG TPA: S16 family serine protease [Gaiellaceae bacterium]|nr:S16 family serine protease [Gaiellaceae bacterium]